MFLVLKHLQNFKQVHWRVVDDFTQHLGLFEMWFVDCSCTLCMHRSTPSPRKKSSMKHCTGDIPGPSQNSFNVLWLKEEPVSSSYLWPGSGRSSCLQWENRGHLVPRPPVPPPSSPAVACSWGHVTVMWTLIISWLKIMWQSCDLVYYYCNTSIMWVM